jgi:hypothetical protein
MNTTKALLVPNIFAFCCAGSVQWEISGCPVKIFSWEFEIGCKRHLAVFLSKQKTANVNGNRTTNGGNEDFIKVTNL